MVVIIRHKYTNPQSNAAYLRQIGSMIMSKTARIMQSSADPTIGIMEETFENKAGE